ncbi:MULTISPECIES: hypothetical protein [Amycolatopsis]|uniref:Uncharacterized protein n=1 Tax=Amycolatopsis tucumanensis TaxID=401106 RepID=A0ABP7JVT1_9PSEU|nr:MULTISPECIES: hypothetical protein [Amycolatopsis]MCF6428678.1 hypothetical protein [Amycolatopsis tucumanensis]
MDFLNAQPLPGGQVLVEMSPNVGQCLYTIAGELLTALETGYRGRRRLRNEDLFPDAYLLIREARAFRERHGAAMRESVTAAVRAVVRGWTGATAFTLDAAWQRAWIITFGHAQVLYLRNPRWRDRRAWARLPVSQRDYTLEWLAHAQDDVALACAVSLCEPPVSGT